MSEEHPFVAAMRLATQFWTDEELAVWLTSPQPLIDNQTPVELLGTYESESLLAVLKSLDEGVYT